MKLDTVRKSYATVGEAAEQLGVTKQAVYKAIYEGRIRARRFAGVYLINRHEVARFTVRRRLVDSRK